MENKSIRPVDSETIMVPTDFTEAAENALKHALMLAKIFSKKVDLLHVVADGRSAGSEEDKALQTMKEMADKFSSSSGIKIDYWVRRGSIFDAIGEFADEIDAALVVMGTHGVTGLQHVVGSKALRVITNANRPFVVVQKKPMREHGFKNIVLPIDFSKQTKQKLVWAAELSARFNCEFHILAAHESDEFAAKAVNNNVAYAEKYLSDRNCKFSVIHALKGDFTKETMRFSATVDADLIVIMTNQEKEFAHYIIGPYEQNVIANDAQIPVMTLNPVDNMTANSGHLFNFGNY
jgi:nucleotide-binding universal stress UspA family protein